MSKIQDSKINKFVGAFLAGCLTLSISYSALAGDHKAALEAVVAERSADIKERDAFRHPVETLSFFKVEPGMAVAEALPGGGWYSTILANYLGKEGELYGVNYVDSMWSRFGFFNEEAIAGQIASTKEFSGKVAEFTDNGIKTDGFTFDTVPNNLTGKLDRVLFIRALHNLSRFEDEAGTLTQALKATHRMLKSGGMVGVVQHQVAESVPDASTKGDRGYMKASRIKSAFKAAGFELVASSDINKNPKDNPTNDEIVWRLPPSFFGAEGDEAKRKAAEAIGESNRMTLLFKKI
jgi:predicted methyltransferase